MISEVADMFVSVFTPSDALAIAQVISLILTILVVLGMKIALSYYGTK
ncbi:hypothetical protein [Staphylococcus equorum]|nr:hypothetical protein [Staphylococcus equorum]